MAANSARCLALAAAVLLAACNGKERTGNTEASSQVPDVAAPVTMVTADPDLARRDMTFAGNDANRDGQVASAEYAASSQRFFAAMDSDDDGTLSLDELEAARAAIGVSDATSSLKTMAAADNDGDGHLTLAEFIGLVNRRFAIADSDGNGLLSPAEFAKGFAEVPAASGQSPATAKPAPVPRAG